MSALLVRPFVQGRPPPPKKDRKNNSAQQTGSNAGNKTVEILKSDKIQQVTLSLLANRT